MINTLEEALDRIKELEAENKQLLSELEYYRNRNYGGRKKHDEAWMAAYNDFVVKYESGMKIMEIVENSDMSRRTAYRYKAYYDEVKKKEEQNILLMDYIKEKLYQQLAIDYCCQVSDIKDDKIILQNMKSLKAGDSLKKRMIVS